jgi:hypothetical protein
MEDKVNAPGTSFEDTPGTATERISDERKDWDSGVNIDTRV